MAWMWIVVLNKKLISTHMSKSEAKIAADKIGGTVHRTRY